MIITQKYTDAIDKALSEGLCFYCYKPPCSEKVVFGASESAAHGFHPESFLIAPFDNNPEGIISIKSDMDETAVLDHSSADTTCADANDSVLYPFPQRSTSRDEHEHEIETIKRFINEADNRKVIAARTIIHNLRKKPSRLFKDLAEKYDSAFVFIFYTPESGLWTGASPELLLEIHEGILRTMSLAGTRLNTDSKELPWDDKNRKEQQIVTDYIFNCLKSFELVTQLNGPFTKKAGPVEHICTEISAPVENVAPFLSPLLLTLSPTPALCGYPKAEAMRLISELEYSNRGYYGGYCGPIHSSEDLALYVNLRSMRVNPDRSRCALFCGGGITRHSIAQEEWTETENKAATLLSFLL